MPECETLFILADNALDYYKNSAEIKQVRIDSLTAALQYLLSIKGLSMENEADLARLKADWAALDKQSQDTIIALSNQVEEQKKAVKKEKRRKNFWKVVAILEPIIIGILILI